MGNGTSSQLEMLFPTGKVELEARSQYRRMALHDAAGNNHEAMIVLLVSKGADIEAGDKNNRTPLISAALNGHQLATKLLLENEADVGAVDINGDSASRVDIAFTIKILLEAKADIASVIVEK